MEQNQATMQNGGQAPQEQQPQAASQDVDQKLLVGGVEPQASNNPFEELYATGKFQPGQLENMTTDELTNVAQEFINNRREGPKAQIVVPGTEAFNKAQEQVQNNQPININSLLDEAEQLMNNKNIVNPFTPPVTPLVTAQPTVPVDNQQAPVDNNTGDNTQNKTQDTIDRELAEQEFTKLESRLDESEREKANLKTRLELTETEKNSMFEELKQAKETIRNRDLSGEFHVPKDTRMYTIVNAVKDFEEVASTNPNSADSEQKQLKLLRVLADTYSHATGGHSIEPMIQQFLIAVGARQTLSSVPSYSTQGAPVDQKTQYVQQKLNVAGRANQYT